MDEAGKGAVLGPMVVAAVCCHTEDECSRLGMRDSKTLSPARREELFALVERHFITAVVIMTPPEIDRCLEETTINVCLARAHAAVIQELRPEKAFVDAVDVIAARHAETMRRFMDWDCTIISEHKADRSYPVVGAASIVAKVIRDREIEGLRRQYGDFGSGYPADPATREYLEQYMREHRSPPPFARKTWKTVTGYLNSLQQRELNEF
ncbi:MAG: ribonuclease HII [Methanomicrobiales archaeon]|nr:ribonuclease HII [Methanomicrobiales archaeon]